MHDLENLEYSLHELTKMGKKRKGVADVEVARVWADGHAYCTDAATLHLHTIVQRMHHVHADRAKDEAWRPPQFKESGEEIIRKVPLSS